MSKQQRVHFVSLGCPKNRVDSEVMLGHLSNAGYATASQAHDADVIVVNTCGFIDAAKEESIDAIAEMAELKKSGSCQKLVVAGCLSQRYAPELADELPEVDHFLGTGNFETIAEVLGVDPSSLTSTAAPRSRLTVLQSGQEAKPTHPRLRGRNALVPFKHDADPTALRPVIIPDPDFTLNAQSPRVATQPFYTAYLKVAEGCSNTCSFCIIPKLRGPQRSRPIADVVAEAERLILRGAVEINLIAQDLCAYGLDLSPRQYLADLLRALHATASQAGRPVWIRCMYAYPKGLTHDVMDAIANSDTVVPYLDMPLQHINDNMLRRMRRGTGGDATRRLITDLRQRVPNLVLRTTFITGLPGESDADFNELHDFIAAERFERLGVFTYSQERDTPAGAMADQVDPEVAAARSNKLMALQQEISRAQQQALVGTRLQVLVEGVSDETELLLQGRHMGQAPDIDGLTYINEGTASPGDLVTIAVDQAGDYDVAGGICV